MTGLFHTPESAWSGMLWTDKEESRTKVDITFL
jgi:hypothetical protein